MGDIREVMVSEMCNGGRGTGNLVLIWPRGHMIPYSL